MRVISMQSPEVWNILQTEGVYHASPDKCRERRDYREDMEMLGGYVPIWCWAYPTLDFLSLYSGEVLEQLRCEMSLQQRNCWDTFLMLEIEINESLLHTGKTHNACIFSKVFAELTLDMVKAVYTVRDSDTKMGWYFKVITPLWLSGNDVMTTQVLDCEYWNKNDDSSTEYLTKSRAGKCLQCGKRTSYVLNNKHFCCLAHAWKHKQRFITNCSIYGVNHKEGLSYYDLLDDNTYSDPRNVVTELLMDRIPK